VKGSERAETVPASTYSPGLAAWGCGERWGLGLLNPAHRAL